MFIVSKRTAASQRKRLAGVLFAVSLCASIGACSDDDGQKPDANATTSADGAQDNNATAALSANPSVTNTTPAPSATPDLTIQSPALPASGTDAALSAAASTPLATPVIHTVD
ncbi:hypothetical protein PQQ51_08125 [Paraburkholderia xenovorans]|uniref:hypothetical protein n=1 Tax=Paraburkholderia xenovorans TaxID=36873 RepID=UPI0038B7AA57